jgi:hypothetical protein
MPKQGAISRTSKGNPITRNPARIEFAAEQLRHLTYTKARDAIVKQWGVGQATAERDIAAAKQLIALELNAIEVRAGEVLRNERIADTAEDLANKAAKAEDWAGAASLHRSAIAASREISRLTCAYAPTEVKVAHSGSVDVDLNIDAVLVVAREIMPPDIYAAFMKGLELIDAAHVSGMFPALTDDAPDAELLDDDPDDKN